jgi:ATP-dependent protease ClpP protease subunit
MPINRIVVIFTTIIVFLGTIAFSSEPTKPSKPEQVPCPDNTMATDCLKCHVIGNFKVRETRPDAHLIYPSEKIKIKGWETNNLYGYYTLEDIRPGDILEFFDYMRLKQIKKVVIEIFSPGGSLFGAQKIVALMDEFEQQGNIIETRLYGAGLSAGFYVFVAGTKGHRLVSREGHLMWHELLSLRGIGWVFETPSDSEEAARILRHIQNIHNQYLSTRGKLSKIEIDDLIHKKEFWMSGEQAIEYGFADGYIK